MQKKFTRDEVFAFIDSQNLNLGTSKDLYKGKGKSIKLIYKGWKLDFKKFRKYLFDKFRVRKAFLFIGYVKQHKKLYAHLQACGYELIFKPTVQDGKGEIKGNVDAELVLHAAAIQHDNYDKAVIVSGDGDFYCLHEHFEKKNKLYKIVIPNRHSESSLLKKFSGYKVFLYREQDKLEFEGNKNGRRRA